MSAPPDPVSATCPKCGRSAPTGAEACPRCGLVFARWSAASAGAAGGPLDDQGRAPVGRAAGRLERRAAARRLRQALLGGRLPGRRRPDVPGLPGSRPHRPIAAKMQARIVGMADGAADAHPAGRARP